MMTSSVQINGLKRCWHKKWSNLRW